MKRGGNEKERKKRIRNIIRSTGVINSQVVHFFVSNAFEGDFGRFYHILEVSVRLYQRKLHLIRAMANDLSHARLDTLHRPKDRMHQHIDGSLMLHKYVYYL